VVLLIPRKLPAITPIKISINGAETHNLIEIILAIK